MTRENALTALPIHLFRECLRPGQVCLAILFLSLSAVHFSLASEIHNVRLARSHEPTLLAVRIVPEATTLWGAVQPKGFHPGRGE